jgi:hypothetical protein
MKRYKDFIYEKEYENESDSDYVKRDSKRDKKSWKDNQRTKLSNRYRSYEDNED